MRGRILAPPLSTNQTIPRNESQGSARHRICGAAGRLAQSLTFAEWYGTRLHTHVARGPAEPLRRRDPCGSGGGSARVGGIGRQQEHKAGLGWRAVPPPRTQGPRRAGPVGPLRPHACQRHHARTVAHGAGSAGPALWAAGVLFWRQCYISEGGHGTTLFLWTGCPHAGGGRQGGDAIGTAEQRRPGRGRAP